MRTMRPRLPSLGEATAATSFETGAPIALQVQPRKRLGARPAPHTARRARRDNGLP
jgi:hypothetical protein